MNTLDQMFDYDEVELVMIANGEELMDESAVDSDVEDIQDEDDEESGDFYDETIEDKCFDHLMESVIADEFRDTRDNGMDTIMEDAVDSSILGIDDDIEAMEDDDDDFDELD